MPVSAVYTIVEKKTGARTRVKAHFKSHVDVADAIGKWNRDHTDKNEYLLEGVLRIDAIDPDLAAPLRYRVVTAMMEVPRYDVVVKNGRLVGEVSRAIAVYEYAGNLYRLTEPDGVRFLSTAF